MAASRDLRSRVADVVMCPICLEPFNSPKSLPCLHTFCLNCIECHYRDNEAGDEVACPMCRQKFNIPESGVTGLVSNFFIADLVEAGKTAVDVAVKVHCEVCLLEFGSDAALSTVYCVDCSQKLCERCSTPHRRWTGGPHKVVSIGSEVVTELIQTQGGKCDKHQGDDVRLYCFNCKMNICLMCFAVEHQQHKCGDVSAVAGECVKQIDVDLETVKERAVWARDEISRLEEERNKFLVGVDDVRDKLVSRGEELKKFIDAQVNELMAEVQSLKTKTCKEIENLNDDMEMKLLAFETFSAYCNELRLKGKPRDITRAANDLHIRATDLLQNDVTLGEYRAPAVVFTPVNIHELIDAGKNLIGKITANEVGIGFIGVFARPASGVVDFASSSFEDILRLSEMSDEVKRIPPYRLLQKFGIVRPFAYRDAEGNQILQNIGRGMFSSDSYIAHLMLTADERTAIVVTDKQVILTQKGEIMGRWDNEWNYTWDQLKEPPCLTGKGLQFLLKERQKWLFGVGSGSVGKIVQISDKDRRPAAQHRCCYCCGYTSPADSVDCRTKVLHEDEDVKGSNLARFLKKESKLLNYNVQSCADCLGRTPYVSLAATIVMCLGVGLFCGTGFRALDITLNVIFDNLFKLKIQWLQNIQIIFLLLGIAMGLFAIVLLLFGFLSTGKTREKVCTGTSCVKGGIGIAVIFTVVTYIVSAAWMAMTSFCAVPIVLFLMLRSICQHEIEHRDYWFLDNYCINMSRFGVYKNFTPGLTSDSLCDEIDLSQFCQSVYDAGPMFCFAFIGSCFIVLGMVIYLMALGSNISRIDSTKPLTDLRRAVDMEVAHSYETNSGNFLI